MSAMQKSLLVVAMLLSFACLAWALKDFEPEKLWPEIVQMNWAWVAAAVLFDILVYFLQGWRWSLLLRPVADIPYARSIRAIYVGLFANEIVPGKPGEIIRCYLQGRWSGLPFSVVLSSVIIERVFDGIWLILCLVVATQLVEVPQIYITAGQILGVLVAIGAALLGSAMFFKRQTREAFAGHKWLSKLNVLLEDLYLIGHSKYLYLSAIASLPYLMLQLLPIYALTQGYGLDINLAQAFVIMVILRIVSVAPQAPGNLGAYQAVATLGLVMFGVDLSMAKRFSFVMWAVITIPLLIAGFIALTITGSRLSELRREAEQAS